jgi:DNA-binding transcriptional LysR family regulator
VFFSNSPAMLVRAAVRGLGIALVPSLAVQGHLERGELVAVLPDVLRSDGRIALVYLERELLAPPVRAFVDWLVARAPAALAPPARGGRETRGRPGKPAGRIARARP